nr:UvrD-like helicase, ATP-binding domain, P-loop containing nucleoside triphosphate hydrolase [Tanacetum cinerariifolium]
MAQAMRVASSPQEWRECGKERGKNLEAFKGYLREAVEIFKSIRKPESIATCYCDLEEYERVGKIYMNTCRNTEAAAKCNLLAGHYSEAVEAYTKGNKFSKCLSVFKKGKLFDIRLQYIKYWKEHVNIQTKEIRQLEQEFLENVSHEPENPKSCAGEEDTTPKMLSSAFDTITTKVKETSDDELVEVVFDRYCGNTPDAKNTKEKGKNKEKQGTTVK